MTLPPPPPETALLSPRLAEPIAKAAVLAFVVLAPLEEDGRIRTPVRFLFLARMIPPPVDVDVDVDIDFGIALE